MSGPAKKISPNAPISMTSRIAAKYYVKLELSSSRNYSKREQTRMLLSRLDLSTCKLVANSSLLEPQSIKTDRDLQ